MSCPHLFQGYVSDNPKKPEEPDVDLAIFTNDIAMLHKQWHAYAVFITILNYFSRISAWLDIWKIKINNAKSTAVFFTDQRFIADANCWC